MVTSRSPHQRLAMIGNRRDRRHGAVCPSLPISISVVGAFLPDLSPPYRQGPLRRRGSVRRGATTGETRLLTAIRRFLVRSWQWSRRTRLQMQLCELSDHLLKDIGLRQERVAQGFAEPDHRLE
jgi:uncharacterized protein YjiS (DUF1127 family)